MKRTLTIGALLFSLTLSAFAQTGQNKTRFVFDMDFQYHFDNRESPFYTGTYVLGELYWNPYHSKDFSLMVNFRFHANKTGYCGCQQLVQLLWNLNSSNL